ncbi:MFS general substrate transporter [Lojkania enalia]|uniref:MFS general substrate transporter n=1 Tax=Lojkania enalia TaxID=147567 RepID=A0A9P4N406_9PLEO|nr:MFS general substrate transporter [Didymosphaeria enalia]
MASATEPASVAASLEKSPTEHAEPIAPVDTPDDAPTTPTDKQDDRNLQAKSTRFWLVFVSLCLTAFTANLNATILSTVIPLIVRDLGAEDEFIWINASFAIAAAIVQPLCGQVSNIFGRRYPMLLSLAIFTLGSGICGGASSVAMLIAGRTVQGLGGGGLMMLLEVIVCDLLPLRERPKYLGVILSVASLGVAVGPTIGGAFGNHSTWRWCFYINVPIGGFGLVLATLLLRLKNPRPATWKAALLRVDALGNAIFIAASCSILVGLTMGGQIYPWSSFRVIVPIVLGVVGWGIFAVHQSSPICKEPTMPPVLFSNRTAVTGFLLVFISCMLLEWTVYYLPYYFQALKGSSPLFSSVQVLPFNIFLVPSAMVNGGLLNKFGQYKPLHWVGFAMYTLGAGLFSTMDAATSVVKWVFWQLFAAWGLGGLIMSTLPAIQASLPESYVATSTGAHSFIRSIGFVWGFTIPSLVFNNRVRANIGMVEDERVRMAITSGEAYSQANGPLIASLSARVKEQAMRLYALSLRDLWYTAIAFSLLGFLLVFVEKRIKLRTQLETEFGLEEGGAEKKKEGEEKA